MENSDFESLLRCLRSFEPSGDAAEEPAGSSTSTMENLFSSLTYDFEHRLHIDQNVHSDNFERSVCDVSLIEEALKDPYANHWQKTLPQPYLLVDVPVDSLEYYQVNNLFSLTSRGISIRKLERVENPYLLAHFLLKKEKMREENGYVSERTLFHGTRKIYVNGICKNNFDWRRRGSSRGHKFGQGVSFTPEVSYARHYTCDNVIIIAKVLVSHSAIGNLFTVVPPEPCDTTQNAKSTVFVKFEDHEFLPQYVAHY